MKRINRRPDPAHQDPFLKIWQAMTHLWSLQNAANRIDPKAHPLRTAALDLTLLQAYGALDALKLPEHVTLAVYGQPSSTLSRRKIAWVQQEGYVYELHLLTDFHDDKTTILDDLDWNAGVLAHRIVKAYPEDIHDKFTLLI